jgi:hypothetical protein
MRWSVLALALLGCRGSDPEPAPATEQDAGCPAALGSATPRTGTKPKLALDDTLRMNHLQLEATHNSYHVKPEKGGHADWQYSHVPLDKQLSEQGVRGLELDTHFNEETCRYEVYHLTLLDEGTTCRMFTDCLQQVRAWSDAHPGHHPLFIQLEPKDNGDEARFVALEKEILSVFPRELLITPDDVKGTAPSLRDAVTKTGWPTLGAARGRVLFYLDRSDAYRDAYTHGRKDLNGRLLFADADESDPFAAVLVRNGALSDRAKIEALVKQGFIVRTFADKSVSASLAGDGEQLTAALAGGAQILSTDFPAKVPETTYFVEIPGGAPSRCNPVTAPSECTTAALEP